mmetsp:Transcript_32243/g.65579  ORF Transcript_32243/g.65579 Transcript_32243/m.65579 type:complete len:277 (-) Transcript_32243:37-867(-)
MIPLLLRDPRQLHVLHIDLLLHNLLQRTQTQLLRLLQCHILIITLRQGALRPLAPRPNRLGLIPHEGPARIRKEQLMPHQIIVAGNQQRHPKRTRHPLLPIPILPLPKRQRQIAHPLRQRLDPNVLIVGESMILRLDPRVIHQGPGVGDESRHGGSDVGVDFGDFFYRGGFEERGGEALFDREDGAVFGLQAHGGGAEFDGFDGVFYLEEAAFGGEGVDASVVFGAGEIHGGRCFGGRSGSWLFLSPLGRMTDLIEEGVRCGAVLVSEVGMKDVII